MARNFYFGPEATMVAGSALFSSLINADAAAFGLTEELASEYAEIDSALQLAYQAATTPSTRTSVAIVEKNDLIKSMQRRAKSLSDIIRSTPTVTDAQLISLGLLVREKRKRRHVPDVPPLVRVISVVGRVVTIRVRDKESQSGRSKPFGARGAQLFSYVGEESPADPRDYYYECFTGRTTVQIILPNSVPSGATVWLSAKWVSARGETSIASVPISFTVQGGPIPAAIPDSMRAAA